MEEKILKKYLKYLYKQYSKEHGVSLSKLKDRRFTIIDAASCHEVPGMIEISDSGEIKTIAVDVIMELKERGWIESESLYFWLTPAGVEEAKISWMRRKFIYMNANPWLAFAISLCALIVSVVGVLFNGNT